MSRVTIFLATVLTMLLSVPGYAKVAEYRAELNGQSNTISTGSSARGNARISVDLIAETVAISLDVVGISVDSLWDQLVKAPVGPIHLHQYANRNLSDASSSQLAFPLPYGRNYKRTRDGFRVRTGSRNYVKAIAPLGQDASFEEFVAALENGTVVINIHTDAFNGGEINGAVKKMNR